MQLIVLNIGLHELINAGHDSRIVQRDRAGFNRCNAVAQYLAVITKLASRLQGRTGADDLCHRVAGKLIDQTVGKGASGADATRCGHRCATVDDDQVHLGVVVQHC